MELLEKQGGPLKELNLPYIPIKRIGVLNYEKNVSINKDSNLFSILKEISPLKAELRQKKNPQFLSLVFRPNIPFGPDPDILRELLFEKADYNFNSVLSETAEGYSVRRINVFGSNSGETVSTGNQRAFTVSGKMIVFRKRGAKPGKDSIIIDLIELYSLYKALKDKAIDRMICTSFFSDYDNSYSFLTAPGTKLSDIVESSSKLKELLYPDNIRVYHPLSGKKIDLQNDVASEQNSSIFIERVSGLEGSNSKPLGSNSKPLDSKRKPSKGSDKSKAFVFKPDGKWLFPFPLFNKRIGLGKIRRHTPGVSPCINCLACVDYCPAELHPSYLYHLVIKGSIDDAVKLNLKACTLCGNCSFVCPASLPLTEVIEGALKELEEPEQESL